MKKVLFLSLFFISLTGFSNSKKIKQGFWHTTFKLNETSVLPVTFFFEKHNRNIHLSIINADEYIHLKDVVIKNDSIIISFPAFASVLKAKVISKTEIEGSWYNLAKNNYRIPFESVNKVVPRFPKNGTDIAIYGKWEVTFDYDTDPNKALGIFAKMGEDEVKGTFLTETGDFRYLDGVISNDSMNLSCFDGSHAFLFRSKLVNDTLWGDFLSGKHYQTKWYAVRNENFELTNPDSLTYTVNNDMIKISLPDLNNETYVYPNENTKNKVTLIQIMGTWCPNCLDESQYLRKQKTKYGDDLEIIAVTFETQKTIEEKIKKVQSYKENLDLDYTFLIGGDACKPCAAKLFPMLNHVISFPTLIFLDKKGEIRRIHTGFNGPGTGNYYTDFMNETEALLNTMIAE